MTWLAGTLPVWTALCPVEDVLDDHQEERYKSQPNDYLATLSIVIRTFDKVIACNMAILLLRQKKPF